MRLEQSQRFYFSSHHAGCRWCTHAVPQGLRCKGKGGQARLLGEVAAVLRQRLI